MKDLTDWKLLDHTADIRMEAYGATLEELFINAAKGLSSLLTPESDSNSEVVRKIDVMLEADEVEDLLIDWLREILFLHEAEDFTLLQTKFTLITEGRLEAGLMGRSIQEGDQPGEEIKAVTYHGLIVEKTEAGYMTRVVFDI